VVINSSNWIGSVSRANPNYASGASRHLPGRPATRRSTIVKCSVIAKGDVEEADKAEALTTNGETTEKPSPHWIKVKNSRYTQLEGREEFFDRG
jgi:hypothetical protein